MTTLVLRITRIKSGCVSSLGSYILWHTFATYRGSSSTICRTKGRQERAKTEMIGRNVQPQSHGYASPRGPVPPKVVTPVPSGSQLHSSNSVKEFSIYIRKSLKGVVICFHAILQRDKLKFMDNINSMSSSAYTSPTDGRKQNMYSDTSTCTLVGENSWMLWSSLDLFYKSIHFNSVPLPRYKILKITTHLEPANSTNTYLTRTVKYISQVKSKSPKITNKIPFIGNQATEPGHLISQGSQQEGRVLGIFLQTLCH